MKEEGQFEGGFDLELLIEYWNHDRFGSGDLKRKLDGFLTEEFDLAENEKFLIANRLLNIWIPEFIHYLKVGDEDLHYFIQALAARLILLEGKDLETVERGNLWGNSVAGLDATQMQLVAKYSVDVRRIQKAIKLSRSRFPTEIGHWLFDKLSKHLEETADTIAAAKQAKSKRDCSERAQDCFLVTASVRKSVANLLIEAGK